MLTLVHPRVSLGSLITLKMSLTLISRTLKRKSGILKNRKGTATVTAIAIVTVTVIVSQRVVKMIVKNKDCNHFTKTRLIC